MEARQLEEVGLQVESDVCQQSAAKEETAAELQPLLAVEAPQQGEPIVHAYSGRSQSNAQTVAVRL